MAGATGMLSTLTGKLAEERKVLAVDVSLSCRERALVPAVAALGLANSMVKLRRTLAAAMLRLTALRGTAASVAIRLRSDRRTSEVKSEMAPATTTSAVTIAVVGGSGGAGEGGGGDGLGAGSAGGGASMVAAAIPPSVHAATTKQPPKAHNIRRGRVACTAV